MHPYWQQLKGNPTGAEVFRLVRKASDGKKFAIERRFTPHEMDQNALSTGYIRRALEDLEVQLDAEIDHYEEVECAS